MIHAMARTIYYQGIMWNYTDLLNKLERGIHFSVFPDGQVVQHADPRTVLWHAKGANRESCGVELLVEGVYDLGALRSLITRPTSAYDVYTRRQYVGLMNIMDYLVETEYVRSPEYNWDLHSIQSAQRKFDPGASFSVATWTEALRFRYGSR